MRMIHASCMQSLHADGTGAVFALPSQLKNFGASIVARNPQLLALGGDNPYAEYPAITPLVGSLIGLKFTGFTRDEYFKRVLAMWDNPQFSPLLALPNIRQMISDHDTGDNDYTHCVSSANQTAMTFYSGCASQEDCNAKQATFITALQGVTKGTPFQDWYNANYTAHATSASAYDFSHIRNPDNTDAGVAGLVPPWVRNQAVDSSNVHQENTDYIGAVPTIDTTWVNAHHPALYWREGWTFAGVRNDSAPDIEFFFTDTVTHRDRTEEHETIAGRGGVFYTAYPKDDGNPYQTRAAFGATQIAWLKARITARQADWAARGIANGFIVLVLNNMLFQLNDSVAQNNPDGLDKYATERRAFLTWLAANVIQNLIIISGDTHYPHIVDYARGDTFDTVTFPNGISNICSSPASMPIFSGLFSSHNVKWSRRNQSFTQLDIDATGATITMHDAVLGVPVCVATMPTGSMHFSSFKDAHGNSVSNFSSIGLK